MISFEQTCDLELIARDETVFIENGWNKNEDRPLTTDEIEYLENNYSCELHDLACETLR